MKKRIGYIVTATLFMAGYLVAQVTPVSAHQDPGACDSNRLNLSIGRDKIQVAQGDVLTYTVTMSNVSAVGLVACSYTNLTVSITLPAADGTPTGTEVTLVSGTTLAAEEPLTTVGTAQYTVAVNQGVTDIVAEARSFGTLHDAPTDHDAEIIKTIGTQVTWSDTSTDDEEDSDLPGLPNTGAVHAL